MFRPGRRHGRVAWAEARASPPVRLPGAGFYRSLGNLSLSLSAPAGHGRAHGRTRATVTRAHSFGFQCSLSLALSLTLSLALSLSLTRSLSLGGGRLSLRSSASFLPFVRATTPQLSQKFLRKFLTQTALRLKMSDIEYVILAGSSFFCVVVDKILSSAFYGSGILARAALNFPRNSTFWSLETERIARPYNILARGSSPARDYTFVDFRSAFRDVIFVVHFW